MDPVGTLIGFSEVSLALAGFAAIVLVLGTRTNPLDAEQLGFVRIMVSNAVGNAFVGLFCVAILAFEISRPFVWVALSTVVLAGTVAVSTLNWIVFIRHFETRFSARAIMWWSVVAAGAAVQLANALGLVSPPSFGLFFLGLVILLSQAGLQFVYLLYILLGRSAA